MTSWKKVKAEATAEATAEVVYRWADQWLGEQVGDASREDVLKALRGHILGPVVIFVEAPDGSTMLHVHGSLVEGDRNPETWDTAEQFALIGPGVDPQVWHLSEDFKETLVNDIEPAASLWVVPEEGIARYAGVDSGAWGYRFDLGGGAKLALLLWHDVLHVTPSGDVASGMGHFKVDPEDEV